MAQTDRIALPWLHGSVPAERLSSDPLAIEIDSAAIDAGRWQALDLEAIGTGLVGSRSVSARFGQLALPARNDNAAPDDFAPFPLIAHNDSEPGVPLPPAEAPRPLMRLFRPSRPADSADLAGDPPEHAAPDAADAVGHVDDEAGDFAAREPLRVMPLPANQPIGWQQRPVRRDGLHQGLDKASIRALIVLMIVAWVGVVGFGLYKATTPDSGAIVKMRD